MPDETTGHWFPNRTWPWRREDDGDPEAEAARKERPVPPSRVVNGRTEYGTPRRDQTTAPFRVIESDARGNRFMVVDDRGDAELGNWFIASTWFKADADFIADCLAARKEAHDPR